MIVECDFHRDISHESSPGELSDVCSAVIVNVCVCALVRVMCVCFVVIFVRTDWITSTSASTSHY